MTVALYIDPRGPYPALLGARRCWDESRDARLYGGPCPVVAHPPCGPWGGLRHQYRGSEHDCAPHAVAQVRRWGGVLEHPAGSLLFDPEPPCLPATEARPDYDGQHCDCWWDDPGDDWDGSDVHCCRCGLGAPLPPPGLAVGPAGIHGPGVMEDRYGGFTLEVEQVEWGHVARKKTWLYVVGVPLERALALIDARPFPGREPTHWVAMLRAARETEARRVVADEEHRRYQAAGEALRVTGYYASRAANLRVIDAAITYLGTPDGGWGETMQAWRELRGAVWVARLSEAETDERARAVVEIVRRHLPECVHVSRPAASEVLS